MVQQKLFRWPENQGFKSHSRAAVVNKCLLNFNAKPSFKQIRGPANGGEFHHSAGDDGSQKVSASSFRGSDFKIYRNTGLCFCMKKHFHPQEEQRERCDLSSCLFELAAWGMELRFGFAARFSPLRPGGIKLRARGSSSFLFPPPFVYLFSDFPQLTLVGAGAAATFSTRTVVIVQMVVLQETGAANQKHSFMPGLPYFFADSNRVHGWGECSKTRYIGFLKHRAACGHVLFGGRHRFVQIQLSCGLNIHVRRCVSGGSHANSGSPMGDPNNSTQTRTQGPPPLGAAAREEAPQVCEHALD